MEKDIYELTINESLEHVIPPLPEEEVSLLKKRLLEEGCRDSLVVWGDVIVDGHNRYRICHEYQIPFSYIQKDFGSEAEAKAWIIENQLGRRNVSNYVKCELVLAIEEKFISEGRKRQGWRKGMKDNVSGQGSLPDQDLFANLQKGDGVASGDAPFDNGVRSADSSDHSADGNAHSSAGAANSSDSESYSSDADVFANLQKGVGGNGNGDGKYDSGKILAKIAGVSPRTFASAKKIFKSDEEDIKQRLRVGAISIHAAEEELKRRSMKRGIRSSVDGDTDTVTDINATDDSDRSQVLSPDPVVTPLFPGYGLVVEPDPTPEGVDFCPPDSVYTVPPIEVYGNAPAGDIELRGKADMAHALGDSRTATDFYVHRMEEVLKSMGLSSRKKENIEQLIEIVKEGCRQVVEMLEEAAG